MEINSLTTTLINVCYSAHILISKKLKIPTNGHSKNNQIRACSDL